MKNKIAPDIIRQAFIILVLVGAAVMITWQMFPYMGGVLAGITLYVILVPLQRKLEKLKWRPSIAAVTLIISSIIGILIPIAGLGLLFYSRIKKALNNTSEITNQIQSQINKVEEYIGYEIGPSIDSDQIKSTLSSLVSGVASSGLNIFIALGIMIFIIYYMLVERETWQNASMTYLPLKKENIQALGDDCIALVKSNALGIPLVAIMQGVVALIGYLIFGVENAFFWFGITTIGSMIPFVGTALGILPVFLLLMAQGDTQGAIGILIYGTVVVGSTDNVFRLIVQKRLADIHPMVTLIGVIVGVPLFGFLGLIFGPLLVSLFLLLVQIYKKEYGKRGETI
ncbi:AI-2E family transporter [Nonlabens ponticola]|uniref:AI-2E family transporter n=1 Tax=Nonlabens ponticola TaxID=2496866 RepID=A0A3S9MX20_9FLAO|nr:AI-2E family transporter [Nonlabens ponticola]AZQ43694.1 AI-2E family transporter [Nonlabens ponticola]